MKSQTLTEQTSMLSFELNDFNNLSSEYLKGKYTFFVIIPQSSNSSDNIFESTHEKMQTLHLRQSFLFIAQ